MTEKECCRRLNDLRLAKEIYTRFLTDSFSALHGDSTIAELLKKTDVELLRLEELIVNGELEDSGDFWGNLGF